MNDSTSYDVTPAKRFFSPSLNMDQPLGVVMQKKYGRFMRNCTRTAVTFGYSIAGIRIN